MIITQSSITSASSDATQTRLLSRSELGLVAGGPMGAPTLGQQPGPQGEAPRQLTMAEVLLVAGGPMGSPTLGVSPDKEVNGSPTR
jgi:hypothetical protein